jgi:hypothetical protein
VSEGTCNRSNAKMQSVFTGGKPSRNGRLTGTVLCVVLLVALWPACVLFTAHAVCVMGGRTADGQVAGWTGKLYLRRLSSDMERSRVFIQSTTTCCQGRTQGG